MQTNSRESSKIGTWCQKIINFWAANNLPKRRKRKSFLDVSGQYQFLQWHTITIQRTSDDIDAVDRDKISCGFELLKINILFYSFFFLQPHIIISFVTRSKQILKESLTTTVANWQNSQNWSRFKLLTIKKIILKIYEYAEIAINFKNTIAYTTWTFWLSEAVRPRAACLQFCPKLLDGSVNRSK